MKKLFKICSVLLLASFSSKAENNALVLTSTGSYVKTSVAPYTGDAVFTMEAWFNGTDPTDYARLISFDNYAFEIAASKGRISIYDGTWNNTTSNTGTGWHHVAVTKNTTNTTVYVDGVQVYQKASVVRAFTSQIMYLGINGKTKTDGKLPVKIDEVRLWNVVRTAQEISDNYKKQLFGNEAGLIAYYQFNYTNAQDKTSSANHLLSDGGSSNSRLERIEAYTISYENTGFGTYLNDYYLDFDGNDDNINRTALTASTSYYTFEGKFNTTNTTSTYRRIFSHSSDALDMAINNGSLVMYLGGGWRATTTSGLNDGKWHHFAFTGAAGTYTLYVDGVQVYQVPPSAGYIVNINGYLIFGSAPNSGSIFDHFAGKLDEIRVWNITRTPQLIAANMNKELAGNESGLQAYLDMNTPLSGTTVADVSTNANNFSRAGASSTNNLPQYMVVTGSSIVTSVDNTEITTESALNIYPNPNMGDFTIEQSENSTIEIMNNTGQTLMQISSIEKTYKISDLAEGMYFVRIQDKGKTVTKKVLVSK